MSETMLQLHILILKFCTKFYMQWKYIFCLLAYMLCGLQDGH